MPASRAAYAQPRPVSVSDRELMRRIDAHYLIAQFAGPRILRDLLRSEGHRIGRKRVRTMMARMGIGAPCRKSRTSQHIRRIGCIRICSAHLAITRSNPVWAPDITYRPITRGFVSLFAVMDRVEDGRRALAG